jgi:mxaJ protein
MSSGFPSIATGMLALAATLALGGAPAAARELRVCADPDNLPFSDANAGGFENKVVAILARDLGASVSYTWWAQRRGFIRNTLRAGLCDLVPGTVAGMEMLRTTAPYYRSGYVFLSREADDRRIASLDDPVLRSLRIGVQLIGEDGDNTPPAHALARRGIVSNVRGFLVAGNGRRAGPDAPIVDAVAAGEIDLALVWGPTAGYFAKSSPVPLRIAPVRPRIDGPMLPMVFDISMGVRREDDKLRAEVDAALQRRRGEVDAVLAAYGVPRLDPPRTGLTPRTGLPPRPGLTPRPGLAKATARSATP